MRLLRTSILALLLACPSTPAVATEAHVSVDTRANWTDNLFSGDSSRLSAWSFSTAPKVELSNDSPRLKWSLSYTPSFEYYPRYQGLNGWNHDAHGRATIGLTRLTTLRVDEEFRQYRSISQFTQAVQGAGGITSLETIEDRTPFNNNVGEISLLHALSRRQQIVLDYSNYLFDFAKDSLTDRTNQAVSLSYSYQWSPKLQLGSRASWSRSELDNQGSIQSSDFYNLGLTGSYSPEKQTQLSIAAGPVWVTSDTPQLSDTTAVGRLPIVRSGNKTYYIDPSSCPRLPDGTTYLGLGCRPLVPTVSVQNAPNGSIVPPRDPLSVPPSGGNSLTYFARAGLAHHWEHWQLNTSFERRDDRSGSAGSSGVANIAALDLVWKPDRKWILRWNASYLLRESTTDRVVDVLTLDSTNVDVAYTLSVLGMPQTFLIPIPVAEVDTRRAVAFTQKSQIETIGGYFRAVYDLTPNVRLHGIFYWAQEKYTLGGQTLRKWDRITAWLGLTYSFDPMTL